MAIVVKAEEQEGRDPELTKVGIITLEDILEEILQHDDLDDSETNELRGERGRVKEKLVLLFSDS